MQILAFLNICKKGYYLFFQNPSHNFWIKAGIFSEMFDTKLSIAEQVREISARSANDYSRNLCLEDGRRTHKTRFVRTIDNTVAQIVPAQRLTGVIHCMQLRMSEHCFLSRFSATVARYDFSIQHDDSAKRPLATFFCSDGFFDC